MRGWPFSKHLHKPKGVKWMWVLYLLDMLVAGFGWETRSCESSQLFLEPQMRADSTGI